MAILSGESHPRPNGPLNGEDPSALNNGVVNVVNLANLPDLVLSDALVMRHKLGPDLEKILNDIMTTISTPTATPSGSDVSSPASLLRDVPDDPQEAIGSHDREDRTKKRKTEISKPMPLTSRFPITSLSFGDIDCTTTKGQ